MNHATILPGAHALVWQGDRLLLLNGLPPAANLVQSFVELHPMSCLAQTEIVSGELSAELILDAPAGMEWVGLRQALVQVPEDWTPLLIRSRQLNIFERDHRFCSACAHPLTKHGTHDTGKICTVCSTLYFPKLSPAMMVVVMRGKELLLAHAPHFTNNMYSALAGFVEAGETLEACVHREVMEEVGVHVTNLRYMGSQSWPFPHSLMLAFLADYVEGEIVPQEGEIVDAQWFPADALPNIPGTHSIAYRLIQQAVEHAKQIKQSNHNVPKQ